MCSKILNSLLFALLFAGCGSADQDSIETCCVTTISVSVPDDTPTLYLTGNLPELGPWNPGKYPMQGEGETRTATLTIPRGAQFEYKFTLGTWEREAVAPDGSTLDNHRQKIRKATTLEHVIVRFRTDPKELLTDWQASGVQGTLHHWADVSSEYLGPDRHVVIWLPPGFDDGGAMRYGVLYMHDGQNLFDPRMRGDGQIWDVDDAVIDLVEGGVIEPIIVVGVFNSAERTWEYSPWHGAPSYAKFLIEELMPRVNAEYPTRTGPEHTMVMGSSMGGLLSYYLITEHPEHFGACGCISTHLAFSEALVSKLFPNIPTSEQPDKTHYIVRDIENGLKFPKSSRYWFDYGTKGLDAEYHAPHQALRKVFLEQGFTEGEDFVMKRYPGADHNEASWRERLHEPLTFMFGRRVP